MVSLIYIAYPSAPPAGAVKLVSVKVDEVSEPKTAEVACAVGAAQLENALPEKLVTGVPVCV